MHVLFLQQNIINMYLNMGIADEYDTRNIRLNLWRKTYCCNKGAGKAAVPALDIGDDAALLKTLSATPLPVWKTDKHWREEV